MSAGATTSCSSAVAFVATLLLIADYQSALAFSSPSSTQKHLSVNGGTVPSKVDSFAEFCLMRLGLDPSSPSSDDSCSPSPGASPNVYWVGTGELYEAYSGRLLATFEGFDVGRGDMVDDDGTHVRQFSRKIFWFRDPMTNEIMTEYNGTQVRPIRYDYQVFDYWRAPPLPDDDEVALSADFSCIGTELPAILPSIVSGPREVPVMPITAETSGRNRLAFQCPVFIDVETPMGSYQAWENYHYTHDITYPEGQPSICVWARQGSNPPFVENGKGVMRSRAHRVDRYEDIPESIRELVEAEGGEYQLFRHPPKDMAEIERLQEEERTRRKR
mmetsp:Transcript_3208/g.9194  ORF Transcript_3208/g.9194 Transcript_3208/m.9194 type:complete len:330 (+) Transcript_3208:149-1138(+)